MKLKQKLSRWIAYLITTSLLCGIGWVEGKQNKGTETSKLKKVYVGTEIKGTLEMMEEYVPKVIIDLKWEKVKEKLVPHEGDPYEGWISCGTRIYGRFGEGTISFGFYDYSIVPSLTMPCSITIDQEENLYILDPVNFTVLKFNKNGGYLDTIRLERVKPKKGISLGRCEIAEGHFLGLVDKGPEKIFVDKEGNIYLKGLKFSKTGKFVDKEPVLFKKESYAFISKVQNSNKGIVQVIDQEENIKLLEISVNLATKLANQNYELQDIEVIGEDKERNLYIKMIITKTIEELEKFKIYNKEQTYKYSSQGELLFIFPEKENHTFQDWITPTTVVTKQGIIYDMVIIWGEEQEEKFFTYKLSPSDKMIRDLEDIEEFLKERKKGDKKEQKIILEFGEGGFKLPKKLKVIKWEKR